MKNNLSSSSNNNRSKTTTRHNPLLAFFSPVLVSDRNEGLDVRVGLDSWFSPSMGAIAESEALLRQVVPPDQGFTSRDKYAGIFRFRFWFGRWIEIVVDDRLVS